VAQGMQVLAVCWLVCVCVEACWFGGSAGSGRLLRESDGSGRACLARLRSACDCACLCGSVPLETPRSVRAILTLQ